MKLTAIFFIGGVEACFSRSELRVIQSDLYDSIQACYKVIGAYEVDPTLKNFLEAETQEQVVQNLENIQQKIQDTLNDTQAIIEC